MSTIVTRSGKGSPLTNTEVDSNFTNLNTDKLQTIASADGSVTVTTVGTAVDISVAADSPASTLLIAVRNTTGATLTKGTAVYISGVTGQMPTVSKALATGDSTSAQTLGLITADLANNANGYVTVSGLVSNINTNGFTDGAQLYLSPITAGTLTATKPYAPQHLVYVAIVVHAHVTQGKLLVKVQNGYEMDELHNVSAQSPSNGQTLVYNTTTSLWEKSFAPILSSATGLPLSTGVTGTLPLANGGTGQTTASAAFNALSPVTTTGDLIIGNGSGTSTRLAIGANSYVLTSNGTTATWSASAGGVTSFSAGTTGFTPSTGTTGTVTLAGTLVLGNGGTGATTVAGAQTNLQVDPAGTAVALAIALG